MKCSRCPRASIRCRFCGRMTCKHFAAGIVDEGAPESERTRVTGIPVVYGPLMGTCSPCRIKRR